MNKLFKIISLALALSLIFCLSSCGAPQEKSDKLQIVASLFPQYDFARIVAGDKADVTLLLPPGTESHTYDPSAKDIYKINNCDLFIYTGKDMEAWADTVISSISNDSVRVLDVSSGIELIRFEHDEDDEHEDENHEGHEHAYDPHIWLNPLLAVEMVKSIADALCEKDPQNADYYRENANAYIDELYQLDRETENAINSASGDTLVFGGRFAYIYFIDRYSLNYETAYNSCSSETEPSLSKIYEIIQFVKENNIPCVFHEELSEAKVAKSIADEAGVQCLTFSTAHNVTKEEFESGITFLDIMRSNLENIKKALNY